MNDQSAEARLAKHIIKLVDSIQEECDRDSVIVKRWVLEAKADAETALAATPDKPSDILERARNAADVIIAINGQHKMSRFEIADLIAKHFSK